MIYLPLVCVPNDEGVGTASWWRGAWVALCTRTGRGATELAWFGSVGKKCIQTRLVEVE